MLGLGGLEQTKAPNYKNKKILGEVVANNDPEKLFRVRIKCKEIYGDTATDDLPWAIPNVDVGIGNTSICGFFGVPIIGSIVYITLQDGDPTFPMYVGGPVVPSNIRALMDTNYPHRYGFVDNRGNHFYVDRATDDVEFNHTSGTKFHITPTGSLNVNVVENETVDIAGNATFNVTGNVTAEVGGNLNAHAGGTGSLVSDGALTLQGSDVTIIGATIAHQGAVTGSSTATYTGTVIGAGKNLATHTHGGVDTGGGNTAPPN